MQYRKDTSVIKRISLLIAAALMAVMMMAASAPMAFAASPFAGNSDHFKHQSNPCQGSGGKAPKCPGSDNSYH